jgi:uncharacterized protein
MRRHAMFALSILLFAIVGLAVLVRWLEPRMAFFPITGEDVTPREFGTPFEAVTIETIDGERLRAWRMTAPLPRAHIVYFHGNGANLSNWAPILAGIVRRGYSVFAIDYRGYGLSTGRPTERGLYRDVEGAVAAAWPDDGQVPLVYWGRSLGGSMAAYGATIRKPDGVIVESGFPDARAVVRNSPVLALLSRFASYRLAAGEYLNRGGVPVLIMHGDRDSVIPFELGQELYAAVKTPKQFVTIRGGDHNDTVAPDPSAYWAAVDHFISTIRARTAHPRGQVSADHSRQ